MLVFKGSADSEKNTQLLQEFRLNSLQASLDLTSVDLTSVPDEKIPYFRKAADLVRVSSSFYNWPENHSTLTDFLDQDKKVIETLSNCLHALFITGRLNASTLKSILVGNNHNTKAMIDLTTHLLSDELASPTQDHGDALQQLPFSSVGYTSGFLGRLPVDITNLVKPFTLFGSLATYATDNETNPAAEEGVMLDSCVWR